VLISCEEFELLVMFSSWLREQDHECTDLEHSDELVSRFLDETPDQEPEEQD